MSRHEPQKLPPLDHCQVHLEQGEFQCPIVIRPVEVMALRLGLEMGALLVTDQLDRRMGPKGGRHES